MSKGVKKKIFVISAQCYTCKEIINISVIQDDLKEKNSSICGTKTFSDEEIKIVQSHGVFEKKQFLYSLKEQH
jgi:uncharacterized protein YydD (DUF2326 family)